MLECCQGFIDPGYGEFVRVDVEVSDCVLDELNKDQQGSKLQSGVGWVSSQLTVAGSSSSSILTIAESLINASRKKSMGMRSSEIGVST